MIQLDVIFSDEGYDTFYLIGEQLESRFGERELNEFRKRVYEVIDIISKFPYIFKALGEEENLRKAFIHKNCSMLYDVGETQIEILFFWDNRQEPFL